MVRRDIAQIPIARLKDATDGRLRFGVIESAGFTTVLDILTSSIPVLQAINGVGPQTAMQVYAAARQVAIAVEDDLKFRVDLDPSNRLSTDLLKELYRWDRLHQAVSGIEDDLGLAALELAPMAGISAPKQGQVGFFTGGPAGGRLKTSMAREWANWASARDARLTQAESALSHSEVKAEVAWSDFERRSVDYYGLLGELVDLKLDVAATEGYLPAEIVAQVHEQSLDDTFSRVSLRGYQSFGARFALVQKRVIIGDEMGLGKTIQAIAAMAHLRAMGATRFLVVCPTSVLINWTREIATRSALSGYRLHGPERVANLKAWKRNGGVGVTTFEGLRALDISRDTTLSMLVVDEAHYVKNPNALRSRSVARIIPQAERTIFLTGTPMENRVEEFKNLVAYLQPDLIPQIGGVQAVVGASAFRKTVAPVYLRRNQEDVLAELPPLVQVDEWEEFGSADFAAYRDAVQAGNFMAMRRAAFACPDPKQSAKLERLLEIADEAGDNGHKVIVFSYFRAVVDTVQRALGSRAFGPLNGSVPAAQRQLLVDAFSAAKGRAVLVSQIQAGGVGMNMQAGSVVILCEPQVKPTLEAQAIARVYRMGQVRSVQVHRLLVANSVDQRMLEILDSKSRLFDEYARRSAIADSSPEAIDISEASLARTVVEQEQERLAMQMMNTTESEGAEAY
jgi:SNF2 family DNA or RNA helicase